jgi:3-hydroxyacyl-[acyl-carrier-protein] dehydratase
LDVRRSTFDVGRSTFDVRRWTFDVGRSTFDVAALQTHLIRNHHPSTFTMIDPLRSALESLPHGPEFRFLDCITRLLPGQSGAAEYHVRGDEPFLAGHFPDQPIFPGVLLIEAAAQLAGAVAQADPDRPPLPNLKLTGIRHAKILGTARPGQTIQIEARVLGRFGHLLQARVTATVLDQVVLETELTLGAAAPSPGPSSAIAL